MASQHPNQAKPMFFVNVYEVDRCYGGPEEGGWYYDAGYASPHQTQIGGKTFFNRSNAVAYCNELNAKLDAEAKEGGYRRNVGSVCYSGGAYQAHVEQHPARSYPEETPYYC